MDQQATQWQTFPGISPTINKATYCSRGCLVRSATGVCYHAMLVQMPNEAAPAWRQVIATGFDDEFTLPNIIEWVYLDQLMQGIEHRAAA